VVPIHLPPLRERREDIAELAQLFVDKYNTRLGRAIRGIDTAAMAKLSEYAWPGNIRELENVIERTLLFTDGDVITLENLPSDIAMPSSEPSCTLVGTRKSDTGTPMRDIVRAATEELEKDLIVRALEQTGGNVTRASHLLQISRKGLQNKMKELGLREPDPES
jgi:DNA-binding NtrC family response regulator